MHGCEDCRTKNLPETVVAIAKHRYDGIDNKRLSKILDVREIMLEMVDDDMSDLLDLEEVVEFFGSAEQESLKKQIHEGKADEEDRQVFLAQKAEWKALLSYRRALQSIQTVDGNIKVAT